MATIDTASLVSPANAGASHDADARPGWIHEVMEFFRQFIVAAFDPYRPEMHYMRGPGPACRAKHPPQD